MSDKQIAEMETAQIARYADELKAKNERLRAANKDLQDWYDASRDDAERLRQERDRALAVLKKLYQLERLYTSRNGQLIAIEAFEVLQTLWSGWRTEERP